MFFYSPLPASCPERRKSPRFHVRTDLPSCEVIDPETRQRHVAFLWDVSDRGACLITEERFVMGSPLALRMAGRPAPVSRVAILVRHNHICLPSARTAWLQGCAFTRPLEPDEFEAVVELGGCFSGAE